VRPTSTAMPTRNVFNGESLGELLKGLGEKWCPGKDSNLGPID